MNIFQAIILGLVQGVTEFLPISSSAHLIIFPEFFGWKEQGYDFDVAVHLATLVAILRTLWPDVRQIVVGLMKRRMTPEALLAAKIFIATLPVMILGLIISDSYLNAIRTLDIVAANLIFWGVILWIADWMHARMKNLVADVRDVTWKQSAMMGMAQAISLLPGTSRSGITMTTGLFMGLDRKVAAKFSFLLGIPAILGAGTFATVDVIQNGFITPWPCIVFGFIAAMISGIIVIQFLFRFLEKFSFKWFAWYRIALGAILIIITFVR
ncbi:MAG: undecaprenyl-diphosphatase UppP [Patescibacteria group bacterium]|jgi:undecaprenyl-diphosphatase